MTTYGDFFTGFGGMTIGAKQAGLDVLFGVEWDTDLAAVYRQNLGDHVRVADVTKLDMTTLPRVNVFHASPPCTNASVANAKGGESPQDIAMSQAVIDYLTLHKPGIFTLENVMGYRHFESWRMIARALLDLGYTYAWQHINMADYGVPHDLGYTYAWQHINMADYGVPQTRRRFIVIARRDGKQPQFPPTTHAKEERRDLFGYTPRWVSWYEAIEGLIPTLPDSQFADWQLARLSEELRESVMIKDGDNYVPVNNGRIPSFTQSSTNAARAFTNGRIVKMTPRAIARFQSFPDWYELPERASLAVKGLGNAVPPLFAKKLYKHLTA